MLFKNWPAICEIKHPLMRAWISYEEDQVTLSLAQLGFPHLFTDKPEEGKMGPFPLSHLRRLMKLYDRKSEHQANCDWDEDEVCRVCKYYQNLPDFPVPNIVIPMEDVSEEILAQIRSHTGDKISYEVYFPHKLYDIVHEGQTFYLGYVDILDISLCVKGAVYIDE